MTGGAFFGFVFGFVFYSLWAVLGLCLWWFAVVQAAGLDAWAVLSGSCCGSAPRSFELWAAVRLLFDGFASVPPKATFVYTIDLT